MEDDFDFITQKELRELYPNTNWAHLDLDDDEIAEKENIHSVAMCICKKVTNVLRMRNTREFETYYAGKSKGGAAAPSVSFDVSIELSPSLFKKTGYKQLLKLPQGVVQHVRKLFYDCETVNITYTPQVEGSGLIPVKVKLVYR